MLGIMLTIVTVGDAALALMFLRARRDAALARRDAETWRARAETWRARAVRWSHGKDAPIPREVTHGT